MSAPTFIDRRSFFGLAASGLLAGQMPAVEQAMATGPAPDGPAGGLSFRAYGKSLDVAGPPEGALGAWARQLQVPLAAGLAGQSGGGGLTLRYRGGVDGVTAANQFDARAMPDGQTALLFSGSVMLAWLAGDDRVWLDPAHMLPVMAAFGPAVLMVQGGLDAQLRRAGRGATAVRLAMGPEPDAAVTAMLGLDLLGVPAVAVRGRGEPVDLATQGRANAVFLHGPEAALRAPALLAAGFRPALSTARGTGDAPGLPGLTAPYFLAGLREGGGADAGSGDAGEGGDRLVAAFHALAAATSLCAVLVLPRLTPAGAILPWRRAVAASLRDPGLAAQAERQAVRLAGGRDSAGSMAPMQIDAPVQGALRSWMAARLAWQPG